MSEDVRQAILGHLRAGRHLTLFLDYDGTLVPIASTPAEALPDHDLLDLLTKLSKAPWIRTILLSGRPLDSLRSLLPVKNLTLGGLYGIELWIDEKPLFRGPPPEEARDKIVMLINAWAKSVEGLSGFLLEDKGQAVALHARWAEAEQANRILASAREMALGLTAGGSFRILDGDRFLEVAPIRADKGQTADWLLMQYPIESDLPVCFGDDNKDESVFAVVQRRGGFAVGVGKRYPLPGVDARLPASESVREWLQSFAEVS